MTFFVSRYIYVVASKERKCISIRRPVGWELGTLGLLMHIKDRIIIFHSQWAQILKHSLSFNPHCYANWIPAKGLGNPKLNYFVLHSSAILSIQFSQMNKQYILVENKVQYNISRLSSKYYHSLHSKPLLLKPKQLGMGKIRTRYFKANSALGISDYQLSKITHYWEFSINMFTARQREKHMIQ